MLTRSGSDFLNYFIFLIPFIFVDKSNLGELTGAVYHCLVGPTSVFCFVFKLKKLGYNNNYMQQVYGWSQGMDLMGGGGGGGGQLVFLLTNPT